MQRGCLAAMLLALTCAPTAEAQTDPCQAVANHLWSRVAVTSLHEQTPLAELMAAEPAAFKGGEKTLVKRGQSIADTLIQDHAADAPLAQKLRDLPPVEATQFGESDIWLLDRVDGALGCHTALVVAVPSGAAAHEIALPDNTDPTALCALSALAAVTIDGTPVLWIEQSGAFSNSLGQSTVVIAGLRDEAFTPPCTVTVDYAMTDQATHAFCDGVDCVPLIRTAEILAMRLRQQETAETLGAGVIASEADDAGYQRMADTVAADKHPAELPTFGVSLGTPYTTFADQVVFPVRLADGSVYLARMGHGGLGWRETADTLLAVYRLRDDRVVPAAGVYVSARRTGITGVAVSAGGATSSSNR